MTAAQITGGAVEFTRPSNYSTDKSGAKVTLSFSCPEGTVHDDAVAMLDAVASLAVAKAFQLTGEKPLPFVPTTAAPAVALVAQSAPSLVEAPTPLSLVGAAHSPATPATTSPAGSTPPALVGNTGDLDRVASPPWVAPLPPTVQQPAALISPGSSSGGPALVGGSPAVDPTLIGATAAPGAASPALISTVAASAPAEITDADLVNAITEANKRMFARATTEEEKQMVPRHLGAALLAHLPVGFSGPPKVQMIPVEKRPAALAAFNAL